MSTKIYNGYRIRNVKSLKDFQNTKLKPFIDNSIKCVEEKIQQTIIKQSVEWFDNCCFGHTPSFQIYDYWGDDLIENRILESRILNLARCNYHGHWTKIEKTKLRDPGFDCSISLTILPYNHSTYFLMLFTEMPEIEKLFEKIEGIEYYGYWDNTDPLEGYTWKQWEKRGEQWDKVFCRNYIPSHNGFNIDIVNNNTNLEPLTLMFLSGGDKIKNHLLNAIESYSYNNYDKRVEKKTESLIIDKIMKRKRERLSTEDTFHDGLKYYNKARKIIKRKPDILNKYKQKVSDILKEKITTEDIDKPIKDILKSTEIKNYKDFLNEV